ncbi:hypothetical protein OUZ56_013614 [Daphnia magna]|uniref:Uncharacterized protein n=1 Tax=Daphnia magna TaxID=35525 RepID=A0ABQ9Z6E6_9CRUS|nr:hypothetical protein OUZ56_013614 [Daphnia magna]
MAQLGLLPLQRGFSTDYDDHLNPSILGEFVGAAFRVTLSFKEKPCKFMLYTPGNLDKFFIGLATMPTQKVDLSFTKEITEHLFEERDVGFGLDLVALNIQRGRLRSYNAYRELCGVGHATNFDDLADSIDPVIIQHFKEVYNSVDDIDLFIGGVSETKSEGSYVGSTFLCILAD